jgi:hypothetical protein
MSEYSGTLVYQDRVQNANRDTVWYDVYFMDGAMFPYQV